MNVKDIREKTVDEIQADLVAARAKLLDLTIKEASKNGGRTPPSARAVRKDIARMLTILTEKEKAQ